MNNKKILIVLTMIVLVACLFTCFTSCSKKGEFGQNVLANANFEEKKSDSSSIANWLASNSSSVSFITNTRDDDAYNVKLGKYYAKLSASSNYIYLAQNVTLEKNAQYRITAYVKVDSIVESDGVGLRFGFDTNAGFKGLNVVDPTEEEWIEVEYYFTSSTDKEVKFVIGIGDSETKTTGVAYVDNVVLEKVKEIPAAYLEQIEEVEVLRYDQKYSLSNGGSTTFVVLMTIASVVMIAGLLILIKLAKKDRKLEEQLSANNENSPIDKKKETLNKICNFLNSNFAYFLYVLIGAFLIRFIISICSYGMASQINDVQSLAELGVSKGLLSFYSKNPDANAPIGITLLYTVLGYLAKAMSIKVASLGYSLLIRLPLVIADIVIVYAIYSFAAKHTNEKQAAVYSGIYAFIPVFFFQSAFYGSVEIIGLAFIVLALMSLLNKDYIFTSLFYMLAIIFSNYSLIILPIILIFEVYGIIKDSQNRIAIIISMVASFVIFYSFSLVCTWDSVAKDGKMFEYFKTMYNYFKSNQYLTTDTFNIYAIFGAASSKGRSTLIEVLNWLFVAGLSILPGYLYIKNKNRSDLVLCSALMFIAYSIVGAGSTIVILPMGLAILIIYLVIVPENRILATFGAMSSLAFLNFAQLASQSGYIASVEGAQYIAFEPKNAFIIIFSILMTVVFFYFVYVVVDIALYNQASEITPSENGIINDMKSFINSFKKDNKKAVKTK